MRLILCLLTAALFASPAAAQEALTRALAEAIAASPTPAIIRMEQADWAQARIDDPDQGADAVDERVGQLRRSAARDRTIRQGRIAPADLSRRCLDTGLLNCTVDDSGSLAMPDGDAIWFQRQAGFTEDEGTSTAMVVLVPDGETLRPVFWLAGALGVLSLETWRPEDTGETYVALPAYGQGTGSHWLGTMFRWNGADRPPTEIEVRSWVDDLNAGHLPTGLGVWKGPRVHWDWLSAESPLWQESDANCCATGGEVFVELMIEDDMVKVRHVAVEDRMLTVAQGTDPDILYWLSRQQHCRVLTTREPYDEAQRVQMAADIARFDCDAIDRQEATLRATHAENVSILALLDRAKAAPVQ